MTHSLLWRLSLSAMIVALDQATKAWIQPGTHIPILGRWFLIHYVENRGVAFGLMGHGPAFLLPATVIATVLILYLLLRTPGQDRMMGWTLALLLGGAVGNLIDRARLGYVIDFIEFSFWPTFNAADMAVSAGIVLLAYRWLFAQESKP
ncbi:MAG: signal peptidase II [Armatimonadetes bacterium]|nr:signal peptidase II [Armatimonadota bacterium]